MAQCKNHPDREAVAVCSVCKTPICSECIAPGEGEPVCFDCSISMAEQELGKKTSVEAAPLPAPAAASREGLSPGIKVLLVLGFIVILGELAVILFVAPPHPAGGGAPALSPAKAATLGTVAETIVISQSLESYKATHGHYPADLSEIANSLPAPLRDRINDPSTRYSVDEKGEYHLEIKGDAPRPMVAGSDLKAPVLKAPAPNGVAP